MSFLHRVPVHFKRFLDWHESMCYKIIDWLEITEYSAMWIAFGEGVFLTLLLVWLF
jgi:hypothetical protein